MKKCMNCLDIKSKDNFRKDVTRPDGLHPYCVDCLKLKNTKYNTTLRGVVNSIYQTEKACSRKRGHSQPEYTLNELYNWVITRPNVEDLFSNWVASGYLKDCKPSIDRLNNEKGYSFNNIQLVTWKENNENGVNSSSYQILQFNIDGGFIKKHESINKAALSLNVSPGHVSNCVNGKQGFYTVGGFIWMAADSYTYQELLSRVNTLIDPRIVIRDDSNRIFIYDDTAVCLEYVKMQHSFLKIKNLNVRNLSREAKNPNNKYIWYYADTKKYLAYKD